MHYLGTGAALAILASAVALLLFQEGQTFDSDDAELDLRIHDARVGLELVACAAASSQRHPLLRFESTSETEDSTATDGPFAASRTAPATPSYEESILSGTITGRIVGRVVRGADSHAVQRFRAVIWSYREPAAGPRSAPHSPAELVHVDGVQPARRGENGEVGGLEPNAPSEESLGFGTLDLALFAEPEDLNMPHSSAPRPSYTQLRSTERVIECQDGRFEIAGILAAGQYVVRVEAPGFAPAVSVPVACAKEETVDVGEIRLDSGGEISGTVLDRRGAPVSNATVYVNCAGKDPSKNAINVTFGPISPQPLQRKSTSTDQGGRYSVSMVIPTWASILVEKQGFAGAELVEVEIEAGSKTEVPPIVLNSGARIHGIVRREGVASKPGTRVSLRPVESTNTGRYFGFQAVTGSHGEFELVGIPEGKYKIGAMSDTSDGNVNPFQVVLELRQSEQEVDVLEGQRYQVALSLKSAKHQASVEPR